MNNGERICHITVVYGEGENHLAPLILGLFFFRLIVLPLRSPEEFRKSSIKKSDKVRTLNFL